MSNSRTVLITGSATGIGAATAAAFLRHGWKVFGTSRTERPASPYPILRLDVRDEHACRACIEDVLARAGRLDAVVSNAGTMTMGPVEEVPPERARDLFETNFWGATHVVRAALPHFRAQRSGHLVVVGSVAGQVAIPLNGFYAATKHALAGLTEALRHEVAGLGVIVTLVEPGDFKTNLWSSPEAVTPSSIPEYAPLRARVLAAVRTLVAAAPDPAPVGERIAAIVDRREDVARERIGLWARVLPRMRALVPARAFEASVRRRFVEGGLS